MNQLVYFMGYSLSNGAYLSKFLFKWTEETKGEDFTKKWKESCCQMIHVTHLLGIKTFGRNTHNHDNTTDLSIQHLSTV